MICCAEYDSPVGRIMMAEEGGSLIGLWLEGQKYFASSVGEEMIPREDVPLFAQAKAWLDRYFAGQRPEPCELPLAPKGSAFRQAVWAQLLQIPYGQTVTYGEIAEAIGCASARAVGGAVGHNPISIVIPCHRVMGANGRMTGYAGGVEKKKLLLTHEGAL